MPKLIFGLIIVAFILSLGSLIVGRYRKRKSLESVQELERLANMDEKILDVEERVVNKSETNQERRDALEERAQTSLKEDESGEKTE